MKRIEQKVLQFIDLYKLIDADDKVLIAFSGGPDSVFALHFLNKFKRKYKIDLCAVHFNHGLRGKESDEDEKFAGEFCKRIHVPFVSKKINVKILAKKNKLSIEEAARSLRYNYLKQIALKTRCNKIVTAHNQSDNTETILMNLFCGTGLSGLSGIPIRRGNIIRPMLCLTKQEIVEYLENEKIGYRVDSSNLSSDHTRNYIRNRILPLIKIKLNPAIDEALFRSSKNFERALRLNEKLIDRLIEQFTIQNPNAISIQLSLAKLFGREIPGEVLKAVLKTYFNHEFEFDDYLKINSLIEKQKGKRVQLSKNLLAYREEDCIRIERLLKSSNQKVEVKIGEQIVVGQKKIGIELAEEKRIEFDGTGREEFISADRLDEKFILRTWKPGDKFKPLGMKGFKKVSDFLTDLKTPSSQKENQLVLLNRNQIVWIVGLRIDDRFKLNPRTKKIYKLWVK